MVKKYLIKRSQVVAILIFLVEIIGSFALVQIDASENILGKIGYVAIIYGVLSTIALYQVKKVGRFSHIHGHVLLVLFRTMYINCIWI